MKKLLFILALNLCVAGVFAQSTAELKNAGNAALKAKDYSADITSLEKYLEA